MNIHHRENPEKLFGFLGMSPSTYTSPSKRNKNSLDSNQRSFVPSGASIMARKTLLVRPAWKVF